jgi:hypothetical protein
MIGAIARHRVQGLRRPQDAAPDRGGDRDPVARRDADSAQAADRRGRGRRDGGPSGRRATELGRLVAVRGASYGTRRLKRAESDRSPLCEQARISANLRPEFPEPTPWERFKRLLPRFPSPPAVVVHSAYRPAANP